MNEQPERVEQFAAIVLRQIRAEATHAPCPSPSGVSTISGMCRRARC